MGDLIRSKRPICIRLDLSLFREPDRISSYKYDASRLYCWSHQKPFSRNAPRKEKPGIGEDPASWGETRYTQAQIDFLMRHSHQGIGMSKKYRSCRCSDAVFLFHPYKYQIRQPYPASWAMESEKEHGSERTAAATTEKQRKKTKIHERASCITSPQIFYLYCHLTATFFVRQIKWVNHHI